MTADGSLTVTQARRDRTRKFAMSSGIVFDARVESDAPDDGVPGATAAKPITLVIGRRVKQLRERPGSKFSGTQLAAEMAKYGVGWNRSTVAKLETGKRASIYVEELLALALVLDVPPAWLLTDVVAGDTVPLADGTPGVQVEHWTASPRIAQRAEIRGGGRSILLDGEPFPYATAGTVRLQHGIDEWSIVMVPVVVRGTVTVFGPQDD